MSNKALPSLLDRHWAESALAIGAVAIAAASLWIAYDANVTNRQLVSAASWPFLEQSFSDATYSGQKRLTVDITDSGIGPAKVESIQLFWHGKAYHSARELLKDCCGYDLPADATQEFITSTLNGWVIRPGQTSHLIWYPYPASDPGPWQKFNTIIESSNKDTPKFQICYCSAFNQCWRTDGHELNPPRLAACPLPKVPFIN